MAKMKKNRQKDFDKVKLKVGKKLPKGQNVTQTNFKSQSIQITEQLKIETSQPTTKKKLSLTELMTRCQHYSHNIRHEGVVGLKELLTVNKQLLKSDLGLIIERTSELFLDKDHNVRKCVHNLLSQIFPFIPALEFSPFFPIMSAYLRCAMTHISDEIQLDSLNFLDLLLNFFPNLVTARNSELLDNFIEQISRKMSGNSQNSSGIKIVDRTLLVNPESKLSSQKWRVKVLTRLQQFLKAKVNFQRENNLPCSMVSNDDIHKISNDHFEIFVSGSNALKIDVEPPNLVLRSMNKSTSSEENEDIMAQKNKLEHFIETLIPLLLQCWVEVGPAQLSADLPGNTLSQEGLNMLDCVLGVLQLLIQHVFYTDSVDGQRMKWMRELYAKDVSHYIMSQFPYSTPAKMAKKIKGSTSEHSQTIISSTHLNLAVCEVMVSFLPPVTHGCKLPEWISKITNYLESKLVTGRLNAENTETVIRVVNKILIADEAMQHKLLKAMAHIAKIKPATSPDGEMMLHFFSNLITEQKFAQWNYGEMNVVSGVLQCFPQQLAKCNANDEDAILFLLTTTALLVSQRQASVLSALKDNLHDILALLPELSGDLQHKMVDLLYWVPTISVSQMKDICLMCLNQLSIPTMNYTCQVLSARLHREPYDSEYASGFISVLITLASGYSSAALDGLSHSSIENSNISNIVLLDDTYEKWISKQQKCECAVREIGFLLNQQQLSIVVRNVIFDVLKIRKTLPLMTAVIFLKMLSGLNTEANPIPQNMLHILATLSIGVIRCSSTCDGQLKTHIQHVVESTLESAIETFPTIIFEMTEVLISEMKDVEQPVHIEDVIIMLNRLLQLPTLKQVMSSQRSELQALAALAQEKFGEGLCTQIWAEYHYSLSCLI